MRDVFNLGTLTVEGFLLIHCVIFTPVASFDLRLFIVLCFSFKKRRDSSAAEQEVPRSASALSLSVILLLDDRSSWEQQERCGAS